MLVRGKEQYVPTGDFLNNPTQGCERDANLVPASRGVREKKYVVVRTGTFFTVPVLFGTFRDQLHYGIFRAINVHCHETKSLQELI